MPRAADGDLTIEEIDELYCELLSQSAEWAAMSADIARAQTRTAALLTELETLRRELRDAGASRTKAAELKEEARTLGAQAARLAGNVPLRSPAGGKA